MRARLWLTLVMFLAGAGLLATAGLAGHAQKKGGTLRIGTIVDPGTMDTGIGADPDLEFATCAKLFNYPDKPAPEGTRVIPEVAKRFPAVSRDGKTQTIELRRSYRFHNGARITAASFIAALNRDASPKLQSFATQYMHEIVGADAAIDGKAESISGLRARGPYTLEIRTTRPLADLPARLAIGAFCPVAPGTPPSEVRAPLGSGPYYVASYVPNRQVVLERNRFYRGPRPANVDRVVRTIGVAPEACRAAVERDELDYCYPGIPVAASRDTADRYGINKGRFFFNPTLSTFFFAFNHDRPAFKGVGQIPLKQAINWAIDRPALVRTVGFLGGRRTDHILPPAFGPKANIYPLGGASERNLTRARALLAKARLKPDKLVLYAIGAGPNVPEAQVFQFDLRRLGIDVEIKYFPPATLFEKAGTRGEPFDVILAGWNLDYADPISFFGPMLNGTTIGKTGNLNLAYFDRSKYNREIARIDRLTGEARRRAWAALDADMMRNDPPWAPFMNGASGMFVSKSLGCFVFQPVAAFVDIAAVCKK